MDIILLISGLVILNLLASVCMLRDKRRSRYEKIAETCLIWLIPAFGALLSLSISCRDPRREKQMEDIEKSFHSLR